MNVQQKRESRVRRHARIRKRVRGVAERPRISVFKSKSHIYAQVIDDDRGITIASASTVDPEVRGGGLKNTGNREAAKKVGMLLGKRALEKGVTKAVFDRGGFIFHGRIRELAASAREAGLDF